MQKIVGSTKNRYRDFIKESLTTAMEHGMGICEAWNRFVIPKSTLHRKVKVAFKTSDMVGKPVDFKLVDFKFNVCNKLILLNCLNIVLIDLMPFPPNFLNLYQYVPIHPSLGWIGTIGLFLNKVPQLMYSWITIMWLAYWHKDLRADVSK